LIIAATSGGLYIRGRHYVYGTSILHIRWLSGFFSCTFRDLVFLNFRIQCGAFEEFSEKIVKNSLNSDLSLQGKGIVDFAFRHCFLNQVIFNCLPLQGSLIGSYWPISGLAFHPVDGILQAVPHVIALFLVPTHFRSHVALLFIEAIWTANIHDCIHANLWPVMGAGYHTIHHTTYKHNYGHYTIWMDWMLGTLRDPEDDSCQRAQKVQWRPCLSSPSCSCNSL